MFKKLITINLIIAWGGISILLVTGLNVRQSNSKYVELGPGEQQAAVGADAKPEAVAPAATGTGSTESSQPNQPGSTQAPPQAPARGATAPSSSGTSNSSGSNAPPPASTPPPSTNPSAPPPPPTTPTVACGQAGGVCTSSQVASHNSTGDCWITYNNSYYIVTSYIPQHPSPAAVFNSQTCGHDITAYMNGSAASANAKWAHSPVAYQILASYKVGPVQ